MNHDYLSLAVKTPQISTNLPLPNQLPPRHLKCCRHPENDLRVFRCRRLHAARGLPCGGALRAARAPLALQLRTVQLAIGTQGQLV